MKKMLFTIVLVLMFAATVHAGLEPSFLPESSHYQGRNSQSFDLGSEGVLDIRLEFAVYAGDEAEAMREMTGYTGEAEDAAFVYAYQIFCEDTSTAELTNFALIGLNPNAVGSVDNDISQAETMTAPNSTVYDSQGVEPMSDGYFNGAKTKAIWEFDGGMMVQGEQSWFLFLYSQHDWIAGDMEVQGSSNDDIPVIPEPATLSLLAAGALLSLKRRK